MRLLSSEQYGSHDQIRTSGNPPLHPQNMDVAKGIAGLPTDIITILQARSHGVRNATPEQHDASFLLPLETFLQYFIVAFSLQQGEVS